MHSLGADQPSPRLIWAAMLSGDRLIDAAAHVTQLAPFLEAESLQRRDVAALGRNVDPRW